MNDEKPAASGGEPPPAEARKARLGRPIGSGGHRQRREAQVAAAEAEAQSVQMQIDMELQQLREVQAMERELRQLQQMQQMRAIQHGQLDMDQVQRQQLLAATDAAGGGLDPPASTGHASIGSMVNAMRGTPAFAFSPEAVSLPPNIAAAQARVAALELQLASDQAKFKEQDKASAAVWQQQQQLPPAAVGSPFLPHTAAAEGRASSLEKQLAAEDIVGGLAKEEEDEAARGGGDSVAATNSSGSSLSTAPAVKARMQPNPRRPPTTNSGFPLPRLSSNDNAYVPPKIKSLDGFGSAYNQMKKNMDKGKKKRKAPVTLGDAKIDTTSTSMGSDDADDISLQRDIFASMIHRRRINLKKHDLSVTGMYSVNIPDSIKKNMLPQKQQEKQSAGHQQAAPTPDVLAPVPAPADAVQRPHFQPPQKKQRTQHHEQQLQMIADLKKQKAILDEQYEQMKAAKEMEAALQATPGIRVTQAGGLLPPILPNAAVGVSSNTSQPQSKSIEQRLKEIERLEQEKAFLDSQLAFSAQAQQQVAQRQFPQIGAAEYTEEKMRATAVSQPQERQSRVANTTMGAASSLLGLVSQQPQAREAQQARTLSTGSRTAEAIEAEALTNPGSAKKSENNGENDVAPA